MHKWVMSTLVVIACLLGVYLLSSGLPDKPKSETAGLAEGQELLKITMTNFEFDKSEYRVKAGTLYKVKLANKLGVHGVKVNGVDLSNDTPEADITFDTPGEYEIRCEIMCGQGHGNMISKIIVE
ncbi:cytochrome c oxidase subunit II [Cohnella panacarvi]|uniref:cytochrome c oxidase subunit II n=1 Tax=Cohnella panacarvi TaxID=400776 RepID=UPI00047EBA2D|nr:cytochrome c oxidase subunit II [Cohnella panacarvi]